MLRVTGLALLALLALSGCDRRSAAAATGPDPRHGAVLMAQHGCGACHSIPGVTGARGRVGPPLDAFGQQAMIAGMLPNTPDNLATWIKTPQSVTPGNAMPNTELSDHDARDIAAYLDTLR
jgi:cytochrome c1